MEQTAVGIIGATGYTALELIRILLRHPCAEITTLTTRRDPQPVSRIHPSLIGRLDLHTQTLDPEDVAQQCDVVFCCLPHVASMETVPRLLDAGARVIDLSADYRLSDPDVYARWYGHKHTDAGRLGRVVYGLPELYAERIPACDLVANPGCYTSASILGLAPLLAAGMVDPAGIIIDAKSGVSGAGRTPKEGSLFVECNESIAAYAVGGHRHTPEIEQVLSDVCGHSVDVLFTPHLVPMDRGILCTMYARPTVDLDQQALLSEMRRFYAGKPFMQVVDHLPATKHVAHTNFCHVTARVVRGRVMVLSVIDNLIKGASGVAVQNFNLMTGCEETAGFPEAGSSSTLRGDDDE